MAWLYGVVTLSFLPIQVLHLTTVESSIQLPSRIASRLAPPDDPALETQLYGRSRQCGRPIGAQCSMGLGRNPLIGNSHFSGPTSNVRISNVRIASYHHYFTAS